MTAPTLPGSIPGLLRRGSPVIPRGADGRPHRGVVCAIIAGTVPGYVVAWSWSEGSGVDSVATWGGGDVLLDLSDATGRAHAAWWAVDYCGAEALRACGLSLLEWTGIRDCATHGLNMSPASIESLRRVCLYVAGVTP